MGAVKLGYNEPRTKGYFMNQQYGLYLPFQFNPEGMSNEKVTNYAPTSIPGLDAQSMPWTYGGAYTLGFKLSFDHRPDHQKVTQPLFSKNQSQLAKTANSVKNVIKNTAIANIPNSSQILSAINIARSLVAGMPDIDLQLLDSAKYLTVDDKDYNEEIGVLPQIAALQTFLRPIDTSQINNKDQYKLGDLQKTLANIKTKNNTTTNRKLIGPPDCYFHLGNRVWRTKLISAPVQELIYNQKMVPVRIDVDISLYILEAYSYQEYLSANATRLSLAFSLSGQDTAVNQTLGNTITF